MRKSIDFPEEDIKSIEAWKSERPHIKSFSEAVRQIVKFYLNQPPKSAGEV